MKQSKRILSVFLALAICIASYCGLGASSADGRVTPAEYVQSFIDTMEPDKGLRTAQTVRVCNEEDQLTGFCVSLAKDGAPHGYVVVKFQKDESGAVVPVVAEYCPEEGVENIYNEIVKDDRLKYSPAVQTMALDAPEKKLYNLSLNEYTVRVVSNGVEEYANYSSSKMSKQEFMNQKEQAKQIKAELKAAKKAAKEQAKKDKEAAKEQAKKDKEQAKKDKEAAKEQAENAAVPALMSFSAAPADVPAASAAESQSGESAEEPADPPAEAPEDPVKEIEYVPWPDGTIGDENVFFSDTYPGRPFIIEAVPDYYQTYKSANRIKAETKKYCCADAVGTNMMYYFFTRGYRNAFPSLIFTFGRLWDATMHAEKIIGHEKYDKIVVELGQVLFTSERDAIVGYLKEQGYTAVTSTYTNLKDQTQMRQMRDAFIQRKPCYLGYSYMRGATLQERQEGLEGPFKAGHATLALGYIASDEGTYLAVNDSWKEHVRFFNLYGFYSEILAMYGFSVKIAEKPDLK